jgi:cytosine deaminase
VGGGLLLRSAGLCGGSTCGGIRLTVPITADLRVQATGVTSIDPPGTLPASAADAVHDLTGYLLLPAPAEPHTHLDKALLADRANNRDGDLIGAVRAMRQVGRVSQQDVLRRARRVALAYLAHGATAIRSHVDVGGAAGLRHLEAMLTLRSQLVGLVTLQLVAMVSPPTTGQAGRENAALLREALAMGADLAGGVPGLDPDPAGAIAGCLSAAADAGRPVDLHIDETLDPDSNELIELAEQVMSIGFPYQVTASHCASMSSRPPEVVAKLAAQVAEASIAVVALPQSNLYLQGRMARQSGGAVPRGITPIQELSDAGVLVAAGADNIRDPFNPMGRADPFETASLLVSAGHLEPAAAYTAVSSSARAVLGLTGTPDSGVLEPRMPADLVAIRADGLAEAIATADPDRTVLSGGRIAVRTRLSRTYPL